MMVLVVNTVRDMDKSRRISRVCYNGARHKRDPGDVVKTFLKASITSEKPVAETFMSHIYSLYIYFVNTYIWRLIDYMSKTTR